MTEAQARRTRLKVWRTVLTDLGGTAKFNDARYRLIRRVAETLGISLECCAAQPLRRLLVLILESYGDTTGWNDPIYRLERKIAVAMGKSLECCQNPPLQELFSDIAGWSFGDPVADWAFGEPDADYTLGKPL